MEEYGKKKCITVGPWGGQDGIKWDDGVYSSVRQLEIAHGACVHSIRVEYDLSGNSVWSEKHGGLGAIKIDKVKLAYPDEFLTSIHGHYGIIEEWGPVMIRSLTFESNKRTYGPYGIELGTCFTFPMNGGKIVGFHGRCGWNLDAIGVHLEPLHKQTHSNSIIQCSQNSYAVGDANEKFAYSLIQGNLDKKYDLIVAVRRKDDYSESSPIFRAPIERVPSNTIKGVVTYGPWGGPGGMIFDDGVYDGIKEINISRNVGIASIRACYEYKGEVIWGNKNGGSGGFKSHKIVFDYPSEILTHITGSHGPTMYMGPNAIRSLTFHTTKGKYGPFGDEQGESFSTNLREGKIVGFHGRKGLFVDAIGVHVIEGKVVSPITTQPNTSIQQPLAINDVDNSLWSLRPGKRGIPEEVVQRVVKDPVPHGSGPWGGDGGKEWDDGVFTGIKQIILTRAHAICSIDIEYDRNGQSVWSVNHGGSGQTTQKIKLEYPHEVVTGISGYYGPISQEEGVKVVKSLTFHTSRRKFGPFGEEVGDFFSSATTQGKVVGFQGRSGMYLYAIGVHMQYWLGNQRAIKSSTFMKIFS